MLDLWVPADGQLTMPMERAEYERAGLAGDLPRLAEWYDGLCVVTGGSQRHAIVAMAVLRAVLPALPDDHLAMFDVGWRTATGQFVPDLLVCRKDLEPTTFVEQVPVLVVEVLSPSTRRGDLTDKRERYAAEGLPWYWVVDPDEPAVIVLGRRGGDLVELQRASRDETIVTIGPWPTSMVPSAIVRDVPSRR